MQTLDSGLYCSVGVSMDRDLLSQDQARVLGSMIEKQFTTPMGYPMSINAIRVACNQKSNRDPVVAFTEDEVFDRMQELQKRGFAAIDDTEYSRTAKYRHNLASVLGLDSGELALLSELFNRGPQTLGELRLRTERMHRFRDGTETEGKLIGLADKGLVRQLERTPGTKEARWAHLMCGEPVHMLAAAPSGPITAATPVTGPTSADLAARVDALESEVADLRSRLMALELKAADCCPT